MSSLYHNHAKTVLHKRTLWLIGDLSNHHHNLAFTPDRGHLTSTQSHTYSSAHLGSSRMTTSSLPLKRCRTMSGAERICSTKFIVVDWLGLLAANTRIEWRNDLCLFRNGDVIFRVNLRAWKRTFRDESFWITTTGHSGTCLTHFEVGSQSQMTSCVVFIWASGSLLCENFWPTLKSSIGVHRSLTVIPFTVYLWEAFRSPNLVSRTLWEASETWKMDFYGLWLFCGSSTGKWNWDYVGLELRNSAVMQAHKSRNYMGDTLTQCRSGHCQIVLFCQSADGWHTHTTAKYPVGTQASAVGENVWSRICAGFRYSPQGSGISFYLKNHYLSFTILLASNQIPSRTSTSNRRGIKSSGCFVLQFTDNL